VSKDTKSSPAPHEVLLQEVFVPAFFGKLAEYGISPRSQAEAEKMLYTGHRLTQAEQLNQLKQAEQNASFWDKAAAYLDEQLGGNSEVVGAAERVDIRQKAAQALRNPQIVKAAIALQDAAFASAQK
jgi:hypothetical protein